ncbi:MAG: hypothetical protein V3T31_01035, partial [candidate division Zixibacteria bacterium]
VQDDGSGTVSLPADCPYETEPEDPMVMIDGFPPGSWIEMDATLTNFNCTSPFLCSSPPGPGLCEAPGGTLGGNYQCFEAGLELKVRGQGGLAGFNRTLFVPMALEIHTGPRTPGDPLQVFPAEIYRAQGELFGDPDFCTFRILAGTDFGLPSPGQTTIEFNDPDWWVESFFDVSYTVEFEGCPGSQLEGYVGTTFATVRWNQGDPGSGTWQEMMEPPTFAESMDLSFVITGGLDVCCIDNTGNINYDPADQVDISDLTKLVNHLFVTFEVLGCPAEANTNGDAACNIDISDLTKRVNHLFVTFENLAGCDPACEGPYD